MINNFILAVNVVLPTFVIIILGFYIKKFGLVDDSSSRRFNNVVFKVFMPILLFKNISSVNLKEEFNPRLILFGIICVVSLFIILCFLVPIFEKDSRKKGVIVQAIFRSNFVLFGLPMVISLMGEESAAVPSMMIMVIVPIYNLLAVIALSIFQDQKINLKQITLSILKNPLILGSFAGLVKVIVGFQLPEFINTVIIDLSRVATPLALLILGSTFKLGSIKNCLKQCVISTISRLIIVPAVFIPISIGMGFRGVELATLLVMLSAPVAVSSYVMAEQMDGHGELASLTVVSTTGFSCITIIFWIFTIRSLGYI